MEVHVVEPLRAGHGLERLHLDLAQVLPRRAAARSGKRDGQQRGREDFWVSFHGAYPERKGAMPGRTIPEYPTRPLCPRSRRMIVLDPPAWVPAPLLRLGPYQLAL